MFMVWQTKHVDHGDGDEETVVSHSELRPSYLLRSLVNLVTKITQLEKMKLQWYDLNAGFKCDTQTNGNRSQFVNLVM